MIRYLACDHPDRDLVRYVVNGFRYGFSLGMTRRPPPNSPCANGSKAQEDPVTMQQLVDKGVAKGHMLGPFDTPPHSPTWFTLRSISCPSRTGRIA